MDTRRVPGIREPFRPADETNVDTGRIDQVELVELRYAVVARGGVGLGSVLPAVILTGLVAIIAILAIATRAGWSVVLGY